ncbi:alpha-(1-_3)-arabinofuranosyltransferase family protein [Corynebacterium sp. H128]|uniref:alpha-(1->3)-arabinofuranosyltransferase domain-containing protein n=1 Tax=Corynebacterium sp. H128 TaxID=3133427 RepID=UPI0030B5D0B8
MALASKAKDHPHLLGWLLILLLSFAQSPGLTVADTKHDLAADPIGFLKNALHAWTDIFPLGQLQNQAYGYLFPQGLFFVLSEPLPDWVAQRLWWTLVAGVGFSGFLLLLNRLAIGTPGWRILGAFLYAFSPRVITTLGAISSEAWPFMLAPWVLFPLVGARPRSSQVAASLLAVAGMGAVNATATAAACVPAFLALLLARAWRPLLGWVLGCAAVSVWWLGPLVILGRYAPPFTDFIESSYVTTRWLNLVEMLRGTTSWAPFADSERMAGTILATSPYFVLLSVAVAALGLAGLASAPQRRLWISLLLVGAMIMAGAHGPLGPEVLSFLDGPGAPLRNVHKFDALVHLPIVVGFVHCASSIRFRHQGRRYAAIALICAVALGSLAPVWSARLAPRGGYEQVPGYWQEAADWLNTNARNTRTVILPQASFARQTWGWTRDEPLQPLLDVPWVVRDAVPLVPPETIRGLDGLMAHPTPEGFARLGVGAAVIRHDLAGATNSKALSTQFRKAGLKVHEFGKVDIVEFNLDHNMHVTTAEPVRVAGGGESLALLDDLNGPSTYRITDNDAQIVTDTPQLLTRNYGSVWNAQSAPLATTAEGEDVRNTVKDYPSGGPLSRIATGDIQVAASSAAAQATAFGGADAARSITAAVDGSPDTAWYPAPGKQKGEKFSMTGAFHRPVVHITTEGAPVVLSIAADTTTVNKVARPGTPLTVELPVTDAEKITITLGASREPVGLAEVKVEGHDVRRILEVPDTSPDVQQFLFQRVFVNTDRIHRLFTAPREMTVRVNASSCSESPKTANESGVSDDFLLDAAPVACGETITLQPGQHELSTTARWISLTTPEFQPAPPPTPIGATVPESTQEQLLVTGRAFNPGLRATVGGVPVVTERVDADTQAFRIPAGSHGEVRLTFIGDTPYRYSLFGGTALLILTALGCVFLLRRRSLTTVPTQLTAWPVTLGICSISVVGGWAGIVALVMAAGILKFTLITRAHLAAAGVCIAGLWLAHAPWPSGTYAGDQWFATLACCISLAALVLPARYLDQRSTGSSTK